MVGIFSVKEKTEGNPPVHDQPERRFLSGIDILTLLLQDQGNCIRT